MVVGRAAGRVAAPGGDRGESPEEFRVIRPPEPGEARVDELPETGIAEIAEVRMDDVRAAGREASSGVETGDLPYLYLVIRPPEPGEARVDELPETGIAEISEVRMDDVRAAGREAASGGDHGESPEEFRVIRPPEPGEARVDELPETGIAEIAEVRMDDVRAAGREAAPGGDRGESPEEFRWIRPPEPGVSRVDKLPETGVSEIAEVRMDDVRAAGHGADPGGHGGESPEVFPAPVHGRRLDSREDGLTVFRLSGDLSARACPGFRKASGPLAGEGDGGFGEPGVPGWPQAFPLPLLPAVGNGEPVSREGLADPAARQFVTFSEASGGKENPENLMSGSPVKTLQAGMDAMPVTGFGEDVLGSMSVSVDCGTSGGREVSETVPDGGSFGTAVACADPGTAMAAENSVGSDNIIFRESSMIWINSSASQETSVVANCSATREAPEVMDSLAGREASGGTDGFKSRESSMIIDVFTPLEASAAKGNIPGLVSSGPGASGDWEAEGLDGAEAPLTLLSMIGSWSVAERAAPPESMSGDMDVPASEDSGVPACVGSGMPFAGIPEAPRSGAGPAVAQGGGRLAFVHGAFKGKTLLGSHLVTGGGHLGMVFTDPSGLAVGASDLGRRRVTVKAVRTAAAEFRKYSGAYRLVLAGTPGRANNWGGMRLVSETEMRSRMFQLLARMLDDDGVRDRLLAGETLEVTPVGQGRVRHFVFHRPGFGTERAASFKEALEDTLRLVEGGDGIKTVGMRTASSHMAIAAGWKGMERFFARTEGQGGKTGWTILPEMVERMLMVLDLCVFTITSNNSSLSPDKAGPMFARYLELRERAASSCGDVTALLEEELSGTDSSGKGISGTEVSGTGAKDMDLVGAEVSSTEVRVAEVMYTGLSGTELVGGMEATDVELSCSEATYTVLSGPAISNSEVMFTELSGREATDTGSAGTELSGSEATDTGIAGTELSGSEATDTGSTGMELKSTESSGTELSCTEVTGTELAGAEVSSKEATDMGLIGTELSNTKATDMEPSGTELMSAESTGTELMSTESTGTEFSSSETVDMEPSGMELMSTESFGTELSSSEATETESSATEHMSPESSVTEGAVSQAEDLLVREAGLSDEDIHGLAATIQAGAVPEGDSPSAEAAPPDVAEPEIEGPEAIKASPEGNEAPDTKAGKRRRSRKARAKLRKQLRMEKAEKAKLAREANLAQKKKKPSDMAEQPQVAVPSEL
ncbi:MAG: hypothetical protein LBT40_16590 [Deltaproteobacteria bacterium]|jgi:uncharacterized protein YjbI with pentapeptide repeats|nr:hypothetical protein [Deltaproteobacteria bacterium]